MKVSRFFDLLQSAHAISFDIQHGRIPSQKNLAKAGLPENFLERFKR